jgi:hypothetical protein
MIHFGRRKWILLVVVLLVVGGAVVWRGLRLSDLPHIATGAAADSDLLHIATGAAAELSCACIFVAGRTRDSCIHDLEPEAQRLISVRIGSDEVTARAGGVAKATARYQQGFGCTLQN